MPSSHGNVGHAPQVPPSCHVITRDLLEEDRLSEENALMLKWPVVWLLAVVLVDRAE